LVITFQTYDLVYVFFKGSRHSGLGGSDHQGISHGLQISKDQDDSSQDADHGYQFNDIGFINDISIFAETPEGMQTLLDVVQEFTTWCGMEINVKKLSCS